MKGLAACLLAGLACHVTLGQVYDSSQSWGLYGSREIDKLPKSDYAEPLWGESWSYWATSDEEEEPKLAVHVKPSFRTGVNGLERLCVIEAAVPNSYRQHGLIRHTARGVSWDQEVGWLAPKAQYRPVWLPVMPGATRAALIVGGRVVAQADYATALEAPAGVFEVDVPDEPLYVDHGYGLMPAWQVMACPGQRVRIHFAARPGCVGPISVSGQFRDDCGQRVASFARRLNPRVHGVMRREVSTDGWRPGKYALKLKAVLPDGESVDAARDVILVEEGRDPGFGAHYANLRYSGPVYVSREETRPWGALWKGSELRDVVVTFLNAPHRFVFWRGTSYVPCWAFNNAWLTYEWFEAEPDLNGAIGCVEPIMDKDCKHSRATIVSASAARVVVHWRYGLTDFVGKVINDEWADEYYYLYPDAVGTRKLVAWYKSGWHENQEFIVLNRAGNAPHKSLEARAMTFLTTDGRSERPVWPRPFLSVRGWPHVISKVNIPGQPSPFMVVDDDAPDVKVWAQPYVDKPGLFNTYLHWPVSRGIRTTWLDDPEDWRRPTHSNLVNIVHDEAVREDDHRIWYWLIGVARNERDLRSLAASWLDGGSVALNSGTFEGYDRSQRAYVIAANPRAKRLSIRVDPDKASIANPAFVISGANRWLTEAECDGAKRIEMGRENGGRDLVVWLEGRFPDGLTLTLH